MERVETSDPDIPVDRAEGDVVLAVGTTCTEDEDASEGPTVGDEPNGEEEGDTNSRKKQSDKDDGAVGTETVSSLDDEKEKDHCQGDAAIKRDIQLAEKNMIRSYHPEGAKKKDNDHYQGDAAIKRDIQRAEKNMIRSYHPGEIKKKDNDHSLDHADIKRDIQRAEMNVSRSYHLPTGDGKKNHNDHNASMGHPDITRHIQRIETDSSRIPQQPPPALHTVSSIMRHAASDIEGLPPEPTTLRLSRNITLPGAYPVEGQPGGRPEVATNSHITNHNTNAAATSCLIDRSESTHPTTSSGSGGLHDESATMTADPDSVEIWDNQLPHANRVSLSGLQQAREITGGERKKEEPVLQKYSPHYFVFGLLVLIFIVLGTVLGLKSLGPEAEQDLAVTSLAPSSAAALSTAPTAAFLLDLPEYSQTVITSDDPTGSTTSSPQFRAYQWVLEDPFIGNYSTARLLQRYALATFFYSTKGDSWFEDGSGKSLRRRAQEEVLESSPGAGNSVPPISGPSNTTGSGQPNSPGASPDSPGGESNGPPQSGGPPPPKPPPTPRADQFAWLDYDAPHECQWYSMSFLDGKSPCNSNGEFANLMLASNNLAGTFPPELALLTSIDIVYLIGNQISGTLPTELFTGWKNVREMMMHGSRLSGSLPSEMGLWKDNIEALHFVKNQFSGSIPDELWQLTRLKKLLLSRNSLLTGTISSLVGNLQELEMLELWGNDWVSEIPSEMGLLKHVHRFEMNGKLGAIPSEFGQLTSMVDFTMSNAGLSSTLPSELGLLTNMIRFDIAGNPGLSGTIPSSMGLLTPTDVNQTASCRKLPRRVESPPNGDLKWVAVGDTGLTGTVPAEWCTSLEILCFDCSEKLCGCGCPCG